MDRREACLGLVGLASAGRSHGAPVPKEDWWLEIQDARKLRHFVRVATGERRKVRIPLPVPSDGVPSPDGKWIVKVTTRAPDLAGLTWKFKDYLHDLVVYPKGSEERGSLIGEIASNTAWAWTRDSKRIVFLTNRDGWRAYSALPDGADSKRLTMTGGFTETTDLQVLPDGRVLHFGGRKLVDFKPSPHCTEHWISGHLVIADGVRDRILCRDSFIGWFELSPDGTHVAYVVDAPATSDLIIHSIRTNRIDRVPVRFFKPSWECRCGGVAWRPDGGAVAFVFGYQLYPRPQDDAPFKHIGIAHLGPDGVRTETVSFGEWEKDEEGHGAIGYSLIRWVTGPEVERDRLAK